MWKAWQGTAAFGGNVALTNERKTQRLAVKWHRFLSAHTISGQLKMGENILIKCGQGKIPEGHDGWQVCGKIIWEAIKVRGESKSRAQSGGDLSQARLGGRITSLIFDNTFFFIYLFCSGTANTATNLRQEREKICLCAPDIFKPDASRWSQRCLRLIPLNFQSHFHECDRMECQPSLVPVQRTSWHFRELLIMKNTHSRGNKIDWNQTSDENPGFLRGKKNRKIHYINIVYFLDVSQR